MTNNFGAKIKYLRQNQALTQEQLAGQLGVTAQAISKWENGSNMPDITLLTDIADCFGVTVDDLLRSNKPVSVFRLDEYVMTDEFKEMSDEDKLDYLWAFQRKHQGATIVAIVLATQVKMPKEKKLPLMSYACESILSHNDNQGRRNTVIFCMSHVCDDEEFNRWLKRCSPRRYDETQNEWFEQMMQNIGDIDACRTQRYKNNALIFNHFFQKATRGYGIPEVEVEWYREKIKLIEFLGEDGEAPDAWLGVYISAYMSLSMNLFIINKAKEGYDALDRAIDLYETRFSKIKPGDILSLGKKALFGNVTKTLKKDGDVYLSIFTQQDERFSSDYYPWTVMSKENLIIEPLDHLSLEMKDDEEFKKRFERVKKLTGEQI
ncbi:MAG: helix-turn-helix transcriptional regulator [Clostridia bacterium]|nr:helix-turn-helix transcriptional regulator [Clostridia bacterium]